MASVDISIGHNWTEDVRYLHGLRDVRPSNASVDLVEIRDIIDIVIDGRNITAKVAEESIFGVIGALVDGAVRLLEGRSRKAIVEFRCEPWELALIPAGDQLEVSLYQIGHRRRVAAHTLAVDAGRFLDALSAAARRMLDDLYGISSSFTSDAFVRDFSETLGRLESMRGDSPPAPDYEPFERVGDRCASTSSATGLTVEYGFDADYAPLRRYGGEHPFDLHALLFAGYLDIEWAGREVRLTGDYPFLCLLDLLDRARTVLSRTDGACERRFRCEDRLPCARFDVVASGSGWTATFGPPRADAETLEVDLPAGECLEPILTAGELLFDDLLELNRRLELNHRLSDVQRDLGELRSRFDELSNTNTYLDAPETYLDQQSHVTPTQRPAEPELSFPHPIDRMHRLFAARRWAFRADRIYLGAVGRGPDGLIVPTDRGAVGLDDRTGEAIWRIGDDDRAPHPPDIAVAGDLVATRRREDLSLVDAATGETVATADAERHPCRGPLVGATHFPSERLAVVASEEGSMAALSTDGRGVVWTFGTDHGRFAGVLAHGPLLAALTQNGFAHGIDPTDGSRLWRVSLGAPVASDPRLHHGRVFSFTEETGRRLAIRSIFPFTGRTRWQVQLEGTLAGEPTFAATRLVVPVEGPRGLELVGLDTEAETPEPAWRASLSASGAELSDPTVCTVEGSPHVTVSSASSALVCIDAGDGDIRWRRSGEGSQSPAPDRPPALVPIEGCLLTVGDRLELRRLDRGSLVQTCDQPVRSPAYLTSAGELTIVVGETSDARDIDDRLVGLDLNHFLAEID